MHGQKLQELLKSYAWDEKDNTDFTKMQSAVLYPIHVFHELTNYHNISNEAYKMKITAIF